MTANLQRTPDCLRRIIERKDEFIQKAENIILHDDSRIFLWERDTGRAVRVLEGHTGVVNWVAPRPHDTMLASSGIDDYVILWDAVGDVPDEAEAAEQRRVLENAISENRDPRRRLLETCMQQ